MGDWKSSNVSYIIKTNEGYRRVSKQTTSRQFFFCKSLKPQACCRPAAWQSKMVLLCSWCAFCKVKSEITQLLAVKSYAVIVHGIITTSVCTKFTEYIIVVFYGPLFTVLYTECNCKVGTKYLRAKTKNVYRMVSV